MALEFHRHFNENALFNIEEIKSSVLQSFPLLCSSKESRDSILNIMRSECIDAFTWATFHPLSVNEKLWSKIILLPLDAKVLKIAKEKIKNV